MSKNLIGMFDPFDKDGNFDAQKVVDSIKESAKESESDTNTDKDEA